MKSVLLVQYKKNLKTDWYFDIFWNARKILGPISAKCSDIPELRNLVSWYA